MNVASLLWLLSPLVHMHEAVNTAAQAPMPTFPGSGPTFPSTSDADGDLAVVPLDNNLAASLQEQLVVDADTGGLSHIKLGSCVGG